jgi:hypothetical protein
MDVEPGETYEVQLRVVTAAGAVSAWSATTEHTVVPMIIGAPVPDGIDVAPGPDGLVVSLDVTTLEERNVGRVLVAYGEVDDRDDAGTVLRHFPVPTNFADLLSLDVFIPLSGAARTLFLWGRFEDVYENVGAWLPSSATAGFEVFYPGQFVSAYFSDASTTDIEFTWERAGAVLATRTVRVTRTGSALTAALEASTGDATTHGVTGSGTAALTIAATHTNSGTVVRVGITAVEAGTPGIDGDDGDDGDLGIQGPPGSPGLPGINTINADPYFNQVDQHWFVGIGGVPLSEEAAYSTPTITGGAVGRQVLRYTDDGTSDFFSEEIPIDALETYRVSVWARQTAGTRTAYLLVAFIDENGDNIEASGAGTTGWGGTGTYFYWDVIGVALPGAWTKYTFLFGPDDIADGTIPAGAVACRIGALTGYAGSGSTTQEFAEFKLEATVDGGNIRAQSVTVEKLFVAILSAISANLGDVTAGTITLTDSGFFRLGVIGYDEDGIFIGIDGGEPAISIRDGNDYLKFKPSTGLDMGQAGSFTATLTGMTSATTGTVFWVRVGRIVFLHFPTAGGITGTSNTTSMTMTGVPAVIWPSTGGKRGYCPVRNNGGEYMGQGIMSSGGVLTFQIAWCSSTPGGVFPATNNFQASGDKGIPIGWTFAYSLD